MSSRSGSARNTGEKVKLGTGNGVSVSDEAGNVPRRVIVELEDRVVGDGDLSRRHQHFGQAGVGAAEGLHANVLAGSRWCAPPILAGWNGVCSLTRAGRVSAGLSETGRFPPLPSRTFRQKEHRPGGYARQSEDRLSEPHFQRSTALSGVRVYVQDYLGAGIVPTPQPR